MVNNRSGFALIELMILINIMAATGLVIPGSVAQSSTINERIAVRTLGNLVQAQTSFQAAVQMDEDGDGVGEFGSLGELSGLVKLIRNGVGVPRPLCPPLLPAQFQTIGAAGFATLSGYHFVLYLPGPPPYAVGHSDTAGGGPNGAVDPNNCESLWSAYAWPVATGTTGNRAFFVNQSGTVLVTDMSITQYSGPWSPAYHAALAFSGMDSPTSAEMWSPGGDANIWTRAR